MTAYMKLTPDCFTTNLNRPISKPIALQSEIERGNSVVYEALRDTINLVEIIQTVEDVIEDNKQFNNVTDGFYMGAYFEAWVYTNLVYKIVKNFASNNEKEISNDYKLYYYNEFYKRQVQYGIDDQKLCEVCQYAYEKIKSDFRYWHAKRTQLAKI